MTTNSNERYLRVFCPTHKVSFSVLGASRILCESGGEALAQNYPYEEFWEYCCDCQSLWPSDLAQGGKAKAQCLVCSRQIKQRHICRHCQVVSLDSDEVARRKEFAITASGAVEPACPGCLKNVDTALHGHQCVEADAEFMTARESCPFCRESIDDVAQERERTLLVSEAATGKSVAEQAARKNSQNSLSIVCPRCGYVGRAEHRFCKNCGNHLEAEASALAGQTLVLQGGYSAVAQNPQSLPPGSVPPLSYGGGVAATPYDSSTFAHGVAPAQSGARSLLIVALVCALTAIGVLSYLLIRANRQTNSSTQSSARIGPTDTTNSQQATETLPGQGTTPKATPSFSQSTPVTTPSPPFANARFAYCKSNRVLVRSTPYLDMSKANVIKMIHRDQKLWALSISSNYDTTYLRSAGGNVTDNWTEVQLYDEPSVRGWVFSYFIGYF